MSDPRELVRAGGLRGADLLAWLSAHPPDERDRALERLLGMGDAQAGIEEPIGKDRMGYMPAAIAPVVRAVLEVPVTGDDVLYDLGAGLGKIVMAVHLLTGARTRGVEVQPELAARGRALAADLRLGAVDFVASDALDADVGDATVVFLYLPFTGAVLAGVMARLESVARRRQLVVCALGLDLRAFRWLRERPGDEFWLSIYDSDIAGAQSRTGRAVSPLAAVGEGVAAGR